MWDDAPNRLRGAVGGESYFFGLGEDLHRIESVFGEPGILTELHIELKNPGDWLSDRANTISFSRILARMEALPEIYFYSGPTASSIFFPVSILYPEDGLMVEYIFDIFDTLPEPNNLDTWQLCFGLEQSKQVTFTIVDSNADEPIGRSLLNQYYLTVEESLITQMDTETFVEFFREHPDECLDLAQYRQQEKNS
jgi:hypothetical protein